MLGRDFQCPESRGNCTLAHKDPSRHPLKWESLSLHPQSWGGKKNHNSLELSYTVRSLTLHRQAIWQLLILSFFSSLTCTKECKLRAPGWLSGLSVPLLISVQVMNSWFMSSSTASGSILTARSQLGILSPSLCSPPLLVHSLSQNKL